MNSPEHQTSTTDDSIETNAPTDAVPGDVAARPVALAAVGSVLYSWYHFYVRGNETYGLFTGLWAPTLLAFASYLQND
jgi:hypothetical protein